MTRVVVTGAGGLVGAELCAELVRRRYAVLALVRRRRLPESGSADGLRQLAVNDLSEFIADPQLLRGCDVLVHLVARVHRTQERSAEAEHLYAAQNTEQTRQLASACVQAGVKRFVFVSSVKALGSASPAGPLRPDAVPHPDDAYGRSKLHAERALIELAAASSLEIAILRAPLVYGPQAGANFRQLVRWVHRGLPLPLAGIANRRSVLSVWNLASALARCCDPGRPVAGTYHVSDGRSVSTPELVRLIAAGLGRAARLVRIEPRLLAGVLRLAGRGPLVERLLGSLELETAGSFAALDWRPPVPVEAGVARAARELVA